jgi:hypothetical protein
MIETLDRLYAVLSGVRLTAISSSNFAIGRKLEDGPLAGVTIIAGEDAVEDLTLPDDSWPHIIIEPALEEETDAILKRVTLLIKCGVKEASRIDALLAILNLVENTKRVLAQNSRLEASGEPYAAGFSVIQTDYVMEDSDKVNTNGYRFSELTIRYTVPKQNETGLSTHSL